jgi:hypothetical protein
MTSATIMRASDEVRGGAAAADPLARLRGLLFLLLAFGILGTTTELLLLVHWESVWQWTPLALFALGMIALIPAAYRPRPGRLRAFQLVMVLFIASGFTGLYLHYHGNAEFELEMSPALAGFELFWKSITGATPALAPGTMVQFGLLGLACTFRHPLLRRRPGSQAEQKEGP